MPLLHPGDRAAAQKSLLVGRDESFQFVEPIEDDLQARDAGNGSVQGQKTAVPAHVDNPAIAERRYRARLSGAIATGTAISDVPPWKYRARPSRDQTGVSPPSRETRAGVWLVASWIRRSQISGRPVSFDS